MEDDLWAFNARQRLAAIWNLSSRSAKETPRPPSVMVVETFEWPVRYNALPPLSPYSISNPDD
jgi:hypothetical protein